MPTRAMAARVSCSSIQLPHRAAGSCFAEGGGEGVEGVGWAVAVQYLPWGPLPGSILHPTGSHICCLDRSMISRPIDGPHRLRDAAGAHPRDTSHRQPQLRGAHKQLVGLGLLLEDAEATVEEATAAALQGAPCASPFTSALDCGCAQMVAPHGRRAPKATG